MIPVSTLYDEYIDRPKLSEQNEPFEFIVPPPQVGRNNKLLQWLRLAKNKKNLKKSLNNFLLSQHEKIPLNSNIRAYKSYFYL